MGKDANLKAKNVRWMAFSPSKTPRGGQIVGGNAVYFAVQGDLLEIVAGNRKKVGRFLPNAPYFLSPSSVGFPMDGRRGVVFGRGRSHRRHREGLLQNGLLLCAC